MRHVLSCQLFVAERNSSFGQIVWAHLNFDAIARKDANVVHSHFAADVGVDYVTVLQLHAKACV